MKPTSNLKTLTINKEIDMAEERLMTQAEAKDFYLHSHMAKGAKRPNKFAHDTIKRRDTDYYSFWKSVDAQIVHHIEELKKSAREEEAKKRADKKKKGVVVDGGEN